MWVAWRVKGALKRPRNPTASKRRRSGRRHGWGAGVDDVRGIPGHHQSSSSTLPWLVHRGPGEKIWRSGSVGTVRHGGLR